MNTKVILKEGGVVLWEAHLPQISLGTKLWLGDQSYDIRSRRIVLDAPVEGSEKGGPIQILVVNKYKSVSGHPLKGPAPDVEEPEEDGDD